MNKKYKVELMGDEQDIDCYGNYDKNEINTCQKCGLKLECSLTTEKMKSESLNIHPVFKESITSGKKLLARRADVSQAVVKLKELTKQTEIVEMKTKEKTEEKKLKKKSSEEVKGDDKKIVKVSSKSEKKSDEEKPKKKAKENKDAISGTHVHNAFKSLYDGVSSLGEAQQKNSVTNFKNKSNGKIMFCFPKVNCSEETTGVFLNRSVGYKGFKDAEHVEVSSEKKSGNLILLVSASKKSQAEGIEMVKKWAKDFEKHLESAPKKSEKKEDEKPKKKKVEEASEEPKKVKKVSKEEKSEKKSEKKSAPIVKPVKKATKVEQIEDEEG